MMAPQELAEAEHMVRKAQLKAIAVTLMPEFVRAALYSGGHPLPLLVRCGRAAGFSLDDQRLLEEGGREYLESRREELPFGV